MEKNPLISFVVPVYNVEKYLDECVNSLINQTQPNNYEIILVDDGSPDNCPKICDEYAKQDNRIKVIHKPNGGLVSARKAGANIASGQYIACVDGDDYISTDLAEKVANIIDKHNCDVICFGFNTGEDMHAEKINFNFGFYDKEKLKNQIYPFLIGSDTVREFPNGLCGKAIKRELYVPEQDTLDERIKIGEDLACTKPIISKANSIYIMEDCLYYYRVNNQSMTKNKKPFSWDGPAIIYQHLSQRLDMSYDFSAQLYRNASHSLFNVILSHFYQDLPQKQIANEIKHNISANPIYVECIKNAKFSSLKGKIMLHLLKHKKVWLMKLYFKFFKK